MKDLFVGYQGRLLCDGLESYSPLESADIDRFGCNMHGRRKFEQAATDGANAGKSIARMVMKLYTRSGLIDLLPAMAAPADEFLGDVLGS
jgi:hypothetical protein